MRFLKTALLLLLAVSAVVLCVIQATDGNLARITGWYRYEAGMPLFGKENAHRLQDVEWMRISDLQDSIECERDEEGNWWITKPFRDRMAPEAVQKILNFTAHATVIETLPNNKGTRRNMREYGVETTPINITLKVKEGEEMTTVARYTLGNPSPWQADAPDGKNLLPTSYLRTDFFGRDKRIHVVTGDIREVFREGLEALRDPRPLRFDPETLRGIDIETALSEKPLQLRRLSSESPWTLSSPVLTGADEDKVNALVRSLTNLSARHVLDAEAVDPEGEPEARILLHGDDGSEPTELVLYPSWENAAGNAVLCYATVNNRQAVFELPAARQLNNKGTYSALLNAATELPVLPDKAMAQVRLSHSTVYTGEMELDWKSLRSLQLAEIDAKDVARIALIAPQDAETLNLIRIPGDAENEVEDVWMFRAPRQSRKARPAENATVQNFLKAFSAIPAEDAVYAAPGADMAPLLAAYGLNTPRYLLMLQPNPCAFRMTLFGHDIPLVKDRHPRTFAISRARDPQSGKLAWFASEYGSNAVYRLSPKFTRMLSLRGEKWKNRALADFPISAVRRLILGYQQAPLELDYDYIGESWTGALRGEDVTPRINPHRAEYYIRHLQKLKVAQWLENDDADALAALQRPVFSVKLELEITDYSDAEATVLEAAASAESEGTDAAAMLTAAEEEDQRLRDLALAERSTHAETRTISIAPADYDTDKPYFYGRMEETGELFILPFDEAQNLAGDILDM